METRQQRRIREIIDGPGEAADTSLRRQAEQHAHEGYVPRTLTPHEWEAWYAEHGIPPDHRGGDHIRRAKSSPAWRRLLARLLP